MFGKKKKSKSKKLEFKIKEYGSYFVFGRHCKNNEWDHSGWYFHGEYNTPEAAERDMIVTGEPESLEYIVIKGIQLDTEEGIASFPTNIKE
jgi:hypothetical protein